MFELEKVLNLSFLVCVTFVLLSAFLMCYVVVFVAVGTTVTATASFFVLLHFCGAIFESGRRRVRNRGKERERDVKGKLASLFQGENHREKLLRNRQTRSRGRSMTESISFLKRFGGSIIALIRTVLFSVLLPVHLTLMWLYIVFIKYPYFVLVGGFLTVRSNGIMILDLMKEARDREKSKLETDYKRDWAAGGDFGRSNKFFRDNQSGVWKEKVVSHAFNGRGEDEEGENVVSTIREMGKTPPYVEKDVDADDTLSAGEDTNVRSPMDVKPGSDITWKRIAEECMKLSKGKEYIAYPRMAKVMNKYGVRSEIYQWVSVHDKKKERDKRGSAEMEDEEEDEDGRFKEGTVTEVLIHHAFFHSEIDPSSGDIEEEDDGDDDFNILFKDFCYFMIGKGGKKGGSRGKANGSDRAIEREDPSDYCPLIRPKTVYLMCRVVTEEEEEGGGGKEEKKTKTT